MMPKQYLEFIESCRNKSYDDELVLHSHHIIPKYLGTNSKDTIRLSIDDHVQAHIILAECYEKGSKDYISNMHAARFIKNKSVKYKNKLLEVYEHLRGDNNPSKLLENKEKISNGLLKYYSSNDNVKKGRTYEEVYGDRAEYEKLKRKKCSRTLDQYKESSLKASNTTKLNGSLAGSNNPNSKPMYIDGVYYGCQREAVEALQMNFREIKKNKIIKYINK
jgi:hypothetical protein